MRIHLMLLLLIFSLPPSLFYEISPCPSPSEWKLRGKGICNFSEDYSCLLNEITNKYEESCRFKARELKVGEQYILKHNPVGELCRNDARFQPFRLKRLKTKCTFVRSNCKEPGQVIFNRGNESTDTTCRCNFKEGWSFVSKPKAMCFGKPSEEDCTCYLKKCLRGYVLTPDYKCVKKQKLNYMSFYCPDMNPQRNNSQGNTLPRLNRIIDKQIEGQSHSLLLIGPTAFLFFCLVYIVLAGVFLISEKLPSFFYIQIRHPTNLTWDTETGSLILTWTNPPPIPDYIFTYKVAYTSNEWEDKTIISIKTYESSCEISDILPLKTYRFTIARCLENSFEGACSDEIIYKSPRPNRPQTLHADGIRGSIKLTWTSPVTSVLKNDGYLIEVSNDGKNFKELIKEIPPDTLEYSIKNTIENITYWFKIYSICNTEKSQATEESYYTGLSHKVTLHIEATQDETDLNDVNSPTYINNVQALESSVREEYKTVEGEQIVSNPKFWKGSFFASFILVSNGFYDQEMLQTVMENAVNKGIFGRLKVSKDGFFMNALNYPVPPKRVTTEVHDRNVKVSWSEPAKTFFKTKGFIIQYTTDNWGKFIKKLVPEDEHEFSIHIASPSTILQVKIYTYIKSSIQSLPSNEVKVDLRDSKLEKLIATTKQTIDTQFEAMQSLFVETSAFKEIYKTLEAKRIVVINGNPGDGKTTLAYRAMHLLTIIGKRPLQINMHNHIDWEIFTNSSKENLVILIDNVFGEYSVSSERVNQWSYQSRVLQDALSHEERKNYLIITIRSEIYRQCGETITSDSFFNSAMVNISLGCEYGLSDDEMKSIFQKYIPDGCNPKWEWSVQTINVQKIGFQLCCRLFKETPNLRKIGLRFFTNPLPSLQTEITKGLINGDMNMAVLVSILLYGGSVKKGTLNNNSSDKELKMAAMKMCSIVDKDFVLFSEAVSNLKSSFVEHTIDLDEDCIRFSHSSIQSTVFFVTGKHRPKELIRNCHYNLLSMMTTSQCSSIEIESLEVPDYCITDLCYRVCKLLNGRSLSSGLFQVISDFCFWNDSRFFKKIVKFDKLLINSRDETGLSMFVYFSAVGCIKLVKHLFKKIALTSDLRFALKAACGANKLEIIDFLLESNVIPDIECSFNAVKGGHIQAIYKLVNAGIDLTQVCTSQTVWDTTTSVLEEAALQNQCHLLEPLLQLCKNLIDIKSSTGATAIHFVASAGDVPLLKKLIDNKTFSPYDTSYIGSTILHFATQNNRFEAVKYIVANYPCLVLGKYFCYEYGTILHTAAQSGNCDLFKYVFDENVKILKSNKAEVIQLERDCHVFINNRKTYSIDRSMILHVKDKSGNTIMHEAAWSRSVQIVQFLIDNGIKVAGCVSNSGLNVLDFAKTRNDNNDMIDFLQKHIS